MQGRKYIRTNVMSVLRRKSEKEIPKWTTGNAPLPAAIISCFFKSVLSSRVISTSQKKAQFRAGLAVALNLLEHPVRIF